MRDIMNAGAFVLLTWLACSGAALAAEDIVIRSAVTPEEAWVGQKVVLHLDVLAKDGWAQIGDMAGIEVDGAYLLQLESQGSRLNETIEGDSFTGQRYSFMLFAQRDGKLTVQSVPVEVEIRTWGASGGTRTEQKMLPSVAFVARVPPGAEGIRGLISTSSLTVTQSWDPEITTATVGDAVKRQIVMRADDVSAMAFTPTQHHNIDDIGIYPGEPSVEDKFVRGDLNGTRVETVTYVFERSGDFEIPSIELTWWNIREEELQHVVLPGLALEVSGSPVADAATVEKVEQQQIRQFTWRTFVALFTVFVGLLLFGSRMAARWKVWRKLRNETEAVHFRRIRWSAKSGDPGAVLRDTMRWLDRISVGSQPARLDLFMQEHGDTKAQHAVWDESEQGVKTFLRQLTAARKAWRRTHRGSKQGRDLIPELNSWSKSF